MLMDLQSLPNATPNGDCTYTTFVSAFSSCAFNQAASTRLLHLAIALYDELQRSSERVHQLIRDLVDHPGLQVTY